MLGAKFSNSEIAMNPKKFGIKCRKKLADSTMERASSFLASGANKFRKGY